MNATLMQPPTLQRDLIKTRCTALCQRLIAAWFESPQSVVPTPAHGAPESSVTDVVTDLLASPACEHLQHEAMQILAAAARGERVTLRAGALMSTLAARYAAFHAEDSLREEGVL